MSSRCWVRFYSGVAGPRRPAAKPGKSPFPALDRHSAFSCWKCRSALCSRPILSGALLYWVNGFQVVALTLALLYYLGGRSWMRYFAPPLLFMLIAVPWPMELEQWAIQGLMRFVAGLTVVVVGLFGIPADRHGNPIEVGNGIVGIDEACNGVRSLQSALMLSLFLGEMHRFSQSRRGLLRAGSLLFVLVANLTRTTILVHTAANQGLAKMESIHDTVGNVVMFIVLPCLIGMAYLIKPKAGPETAPASPPPPAPAPRPPDLFPATPRWVGITALLWLLLIQGVTEFWYRSHESKLVLNTPWTFNWPMQDANYRKNAIPQTSLAILRCTDSQAANWTDEGGNDWSAFLLRWSPGRNSEQLAKGHRPDICVPAAGALLADDYGRITLQPNGVSMTFRD